MGAKREERRVSVNSYRRDAVRPLAGTLWVWEPDSPHAIALIKVTRVRWNGEEWHVGARALLYDPAKPLEPARWTNESWNDLSRFWEACHRVAPMAGAPTVGGQFRRGEPQPDEVPADA